MKKITLITLISILSLFLVSPLMATTVMDGDDEDDHFIQSDEYFIADEYFVDQTWMTVMLAKELVAPSKKTKNEGQYLRIADGKKVWTKVVYQTIAATIKDLELGLEIIAMDATDSDGLYYAPDDRETASNAPWFIARIVDMSDVYKGYVTVSGGYKVRIDAIRILVHG